MTLQQLTIKSSQKPNGFSLLELLLVIVILGVLASLGLTTYQKKSDTTKIDKATLEIQSILQAANAFYLTGSNGNTSNAYNHWPAFEGLTDQLPGYFSNYLPLPTNATAVTMTNPWGNNYLIDGSSTFKFKVQTKVPNPNIAQQLASSIPYGAVDANDNTIVYSYVSAPGQQLSLGIIFKEIGTVKNKGTVDIPQDCPPGTIASIITAMNYVRTDLSDVSNVIWKPDSPHIIASPITLLSAETTVSNKQWQVNISLMKASDCDPGAFSTIDNSCKDGKQSGKWNDKNVEAKMLYIVYCNPKTSGPK